MNNSEQSNDWIKNPDAPGYGRAVSFDSSLGQCVLNDLAIRYPRFNPKYMRQDHFYDDLPHDMVSAYAIGPEDVTIDIVDDNGVPRPQVYHNDIASVTYTLTGDVLTFCKGYSFYDFAKPDLSHIWPDLREFYKFYERIKQSNPDVVDMIEHFATIYEKQLAEHNEAHEPLALRELLWNFGKAVVEAETNPNH